MGVFIRERRGEFAAHRPKDAQRRSYKEGHRDQHCASRYSPPPAKEHLGPPEAERGRKGSPLETLEGRYSAHLGLLASGTPENTFLLFSATKFVVIFSRNTKKLIQVSCMGSWNGKITLGKNS